MADFNHLAPSIDRMFRFVEMIGVTALLGTVLAARGPVFGPSVIFLGTLMAITYLIEPPVEWLASLVIGEKPTIPRALGAIGVFSLSFALSIVAAPFVGELALLIGKTIR